MVGLVSSANGDDLRTGILFGTVFAVVMLACVLVLRRTGGKDRI